MTTIDLTALLPLIVLAATSVILLLGLAIHRSYEFTVGLTLAGLALAFIALWSAFAVAPRPVTSLLMIDSYALFFMGLLFAASFVVAVLSHEYFKSRAGEHEEFYLLLVLATLGCGVLVASINFVSFFLGLEVLSVSLYALVGYRRTDPHGLDAAIKYLILAGTSTAFLLFGIALIYAETGTLLFAHNVIVQAASGQLLSLIGLGMVVIGVGFKLGVVPFHMWTPDVYQGAPAPVTAFVATVSKGAIFALMVRYFTQLNVHMSNSLLLVFTLIALASMLAGNLLALRQNNLKRLLAYSSIAHIGYLLVAFLASGTAADLAVAFYLTAYFATTLTAFGLIGALSGEREADQLDHYRGLFWRRPWIAAALTIALLSLAGIPLTAGFVGKFFVVLAGVGSALWLLVISLVVNSAIGLFYYRRVIVAMAVRPAEEERPAAALPKLPAASSLVLTVLTLLIVGLGVFPTPLIGLIQALVNNFA
jgi:NADH-quinone oxidoreductase subunit N